MRRNSKVEDPVFILAREAARRADEATERADKGPAGNARDAQGRMGHAYQAEAAEANRQAASWMRKAALKGMPNAKEQAEHYSQKAERHTDQVPIALGGRQDAMLEHLASVGLREHEETLRSQPLPGVSSDEISALIQKHRQPLSQALAGLIYEAQQAEVGPWVVLARVEQERIIEKPGRPDIGEPHKFKEVDKPVALVWGRGDSARNMEKAGAYAEKEGYMVFVYPPAEEDPLGRAKLDAQVRVRTEADRALRSLRPSRIVRLHRVLATGEKGFAPYMETGSRADEAAWTRELRALERVGLVSNSNGWYWRLTPLGRRVVEQADERAATKARTRADRARSAPALDPSQIRTVRLRNGREVLAKHQDGELEAIKYTNRTQAEAKARLLGTGWTVSQFTGRPFYVVKEP